MDHVAQQTVSLPVSTSCPMTKSISSNDCPNDCPILPMIISMISQWSWLFHTYIQWYVYIYICILYIWSRPPSLHPPPMGWGGGGSSPLGIHDPHCVPIYVTGQVWCSKVGSQVWYSAFNIIQHVPSKKWSVVRCCNFFYLSSDDSQSRVLRLKRRRSSRL